MTTKRDHNKTSVVVNYREAAMPRYHFVVRTPDHTHDDPDGMDFPNLEAAKEHGHRIVRELREEDGYTPGDSALLIQDETRETTPLDLVLRRRRREADA
jgi:hypothetical protein